MCQETGLVASGSFRGSSFCYKIYSGGESWNEMRATNAEMEFLSAASIMSDEAPRNGQNENDDGVAAMLSLPDMLRRTLLTDL